MRFTAQYPLDDVVGSPAWASPRAVCGYAEAAEAAGFDAIAFTDHPAPPSSWLDSGGHAALDPFVALTACAAATERLRLMTFLAIAGYRNPFLLAKSAASLDLLSAGRLVLGVGAGYLRGEFAALGADADDRQAALDEAVQLLPAIWSGGAVTRAGRTFTAEAVVSMPAPRRPIPIWVGGNSRRTRRIVARWAGGWTPLLVEDGPAARAGTAPLPDLGALESAIGELRDLTAEAGRDPDAIDVQIKSPLSRLDGRFDPSRYRDHVAQLAAAGVTSFVVHPLDPSSDAATDTVARFGHDVIATVPQPV